MNEVTLPIVIRELKFKLVKKGIPIILSFLLCYLCGNAQDGSTSMLKLEELEGEWFINMSNFPMWLKGDKTNPRFNYSIVEKNSKIGLSDKVDFIENGREKSILGYDTPLNPNYTKFRWRGKGMLKLLKSNWEIIYYDKDEEWILLYFEKTLFTPKGYDVISRKPRLALETESIIRKKLKNLGIDSQLSKIN